jgi:hypothetical protein
MDDKKIINLALSFGFDLYDSDSLIRFAIEMQAMALYDFANWCRKSGDGSERVSWADVAENAELAALELGPITTKI